MHEYCVYLGKYTKPPYALSALPRLPEKRLFGFAVCVEPCRDRVWKRLKELRRGDEGGVLLSKTHAHPNKLLTEQDGRGKGGRERESSQTHKEKGAIGHLWSVPCYFAAALESANGPKL
ncbi:solute carrier family 9 (sodium/hydrogen exchanger), member 3 [Sarotherodon galilaeus]